MDKVESKAEIRRRMRARRKALTPEERARASEIICGKLTACAALADALACGGVVAVYLASPDEIDLSAFIREMLRRGTTVVSPRWNGRAYNLAKLSSLSEGDLRHGPMNILEPAAEQLVEPGEVAAWIAPGLAFTKNGKRLGYGGGWYDRLLAAAAERSVKIGVGHGFQVVDDLPGEPHDIPLDMVISD